MGTIADLIHYRSVKERTVEPIAEHPVTTRYGAFHLTTFRDLASGDLHFSLHKGKIQADEPTLVRVHVMDAVKDILALQREQDDFIPWTFQDAIQRVAQEGQGVVVLMCYNQTSGEMEERIEQMLAGQSQKATQDRVYRQVGTGAQILKELGVHKMRLMSAPFKFSALSGFDLAVVEVMDAP